MGRRGSLGDPEVRRPDRSEDHLISRGVEIGARMKEPGAILWVWCDETPRIFHLSHLLAILLSWCLFLPSSVSAETKGAVTPLLRLSVENLGNQQYEEIIGYGTPIRSVFGGVKLSF